MPIVIPNNLPATEVLQSENIFVMTENRATTQQIRPLKILLLNLMPTKIATETQMARLVETLPFRCSWTSLFLRPIIPRIPLWST